MEAALLPRAPPAVKAPIHTQHTGQHGDDGLAELIPWIWPGGSHGATTPLPGWSWGSEPGSGLSAYRIGRGAIQGRTPGLHRGPAVMGSDPTRGRQCGHTGSTGRPGKNGETPAPAHIHIHTHTHYDTPHTTCIPPTAQSTLLSKHENYVALRFVGRWRRNTRTAVSGHHCLS